MHDSAEENSATLKISTGTETRRLKVSPASFRYYDLVKEAFKTLKAEEKQGHEVVTTYVDDEDDIITITTDEELAEAFRIAKFNAAKRWTLKVNVSLRRVNKNDGGRQNVAPAFVPKSDSSEDEAKGARSEDQSTLERVQLRQGKKATKSRDKGAAAKVKVVAQSPVNLIKRAKLNDERAQKFAERARVMQEKAQKFQARAEKSTLRAEKLKAKASKKSGDGAAANKPTKPVPLRTTSGGVRFFLDGTAEFGGTGEARLHPNGTVSCVLQDNGFPSVMAQGVGVSSGKWYYEATVLTPGLMQIGWATDLFTGNADAGEGVGDDASSWAIDGYRQARWHKGIRTPWNIGPWRAGDVVCCAIDLNNSIMRFALNGNWSDQDAPFYGFNIPSDHGVAPAASFSRNEKLRFNFGAPGTPFKYGPPSTSEDTEYLAIWEAYGTNANTVRAEPTRPAHWESSTPPTGRPGESTQTDPAVSTVCELLADVKVRSSISKALSNASVAEALQAILIASVHSPDSIADVVASQMIHIAPVYFQLVAECPEVLAAVPALSRLLCGKRPGRGRGCKWARCQGKIWRRQQRNQHYHQRQQQEQQQEQQQQHKQRQQHTKSGEQFQEASVPAIVSNLTDLISNASQKIFGHDVEMQKAIAASLYKEAQTFADNVGKTIESTINATAEAGKAAVAAASMPAGESSPKPVDEDDGQSRQQQPQQKEQPQKIESKQLRAKYVKDPDSKALVVVPNEVFKHTWKIKNTGDSAWPQGVVLKSVGGDDIKGSGTRVTLLELGPGETIDVPLTFTAPSQEGRFISYWRLSHNDKKFGDRMWVDMTVQKHDESSSDSGSVEDSDGDGVETTGRNVDDMTDWVAVADAMRASGSSKSAPMNDEGKPISKEKEEPAIPEQSSSPASPHHESKFSRELAIMASMGFGNDAHVLHALEAQNGNIGEAVNLLLASQT